MFHATYVLDSRVEALLAEVATLILEGLLARAVPMDFARVLALENGSGEEPHYCLRNDPVAIQHLHHIGCGLKMLLEREDLPGFVVPRLEKLCQRIEVIINDAVNREGLE